MTPRSHNPWVLPKVQFVPLHSRSVVLETNMSSSLVRKLLRATEEEGTSHTDAPSGKAAASTKAQFRQRQRQDARRDKEQSRQAQLASPQQILDWQVNLMLHRDQQQQSQLLRTSVHPKKTSKKGIATGHPRMIASARSAAQQSQIAQVPTFNKRTYQKERKKASIARVAKLLKKTSGKPW